MSRSSSSTPLSPSADNADVTIGIDLGNAYCCVAHYSKSSSQVIVIANEEGNRVTPSCISFTKEDTLVGEPGKEQIPRNAPNTIADIKKLAGLIVSGATQEQNEQLIKTEMQKQGWPFALKQQKQMIVAEVESKGETKQFTIQQLTTMLIDKVKKSAEAFLGKFVQYAVFAVPVYFTEIQRTLVKVSAEKAGLKVLAVINEPVAAAIAYGLDTTTKQQQPQKKLAVVLDIGASSCEASLLNVENGLIEIRSRVANRNLGAAEFDNRLVQLCIQEFFKKYKTDLTNNKRAVNTLKIACEKAKMALSISQTASVECDSLYDGMDFSQSITRARFEQVNNDIFNSASIQLIQHVLFHATVDKSEVTDVILCGGGNNIPKIQQLVTDYFAGTNATIQKSITPEEVIAAGVAIEGFSLVEKIARQQQQEQVSIQVTPLTIGVEGYQGLMAPVIPRNTTLPTSKTVEFGVSQDGQAHIYLQVAEGERVLAKNNRQIGYVVIPLAESEQKRGTKISVTFQVNESGQLSITSTSSQQAKFIVKQSAPSASAPASVEELLLNAKQNRQADEKVKQEILASMGLEQLKL